MGERVERDAPLQPRGRIAEFVSGDRMGKLMDRDTKNQYQQIDEAEEGIFGDDVEHNE